MGDVTALLGGADQRLHGRVRPVEQRAVRRGLGTLLLQHLFLLWRSDLQAIRDDLNSLKDTLSRFMSQASDEALKSARQVTSNVAGQVSDVASDLANRGGQLASSAGDQAKTFANELEGMARRNPLGALERGGRRRVDRHYGTAKLMLFKILKLFGLRCPRKSRGGEIDDRAAR
jgi:ElaB/YqjD/DUF883 family membrane-anchored ribosome-binding protein